MLLILLTGLELVLLLRWSLVFWACHFCTDMHGFDDDPILIFNTEFWLYVFIMQPWKDVSVKYDTWKTSFWST